MKHHDEVEKYYNTRNRPVSVSVSGFDFGNLACGMDSPNPLPEKITYDYELTDLKRGYGLEPETLAVAVATSVPVAPSVSSASVATSPLNAPATPAAAGGTDVGSPQGLPPRCDAWSRWARTVRRMRS